MNRAVFLDRDGIINRKAPEGDYITSWEDMHLLPDVAESIALFNGARFRVIVVTNQRCVAKGLITLAQLEDLHLRMCNELARLGAVVDAVYYCPHDKQPPCECRKPAPGMLLNAAKEAGIDLAASWMIGDSASDVEAGRAAGCRTVQIRSEHDARPSDADVVVPLLSQAARLILET